MVIKVALVFGGRSTEHKVSVTSARTVARALEVAGFEVVPLAIAQDGCWAPAELGRRALAGELDTVAPLGERIANTLHRLLEVEVDVVFPIVHGTWGEDGALQGLCEMLDLPYVGTGVLSSAVCMDKAICKQVLSASGLPVVDWELVERRHFEADRGAVLRRLERLATPIFVKPSVGGSSVGVRRVNDRAELAPALEHALLFDDRLVVEVGIVGRELECAVLGYGALEASGIGEIVPGKEFYDYADKYLEDGAELIHQAELPEGVEQELRQMATAAFAATDGWGMARVDFLVGEAGTFINEINTLPGFTAISMYPKLWQVAGLSLAQLVTRLVDVARQRHTGRRQLDHGIKEWIASLEPGQSS